MNFDLFISRVWIVLPALFVVFLNVTAVVIVWHYIHLWKTEKFNDVSSNLWIAVMVAGIMDVVFCAMLDVGQSLVLFTESWGGLVAVCTTILMPLIGYKAYTKVQSPKAGSIEPMIPPKE